MTDSDCDPIKCYWLDTCPVCHEPCVSACRCQLNDRYCQNNHTWRRLDNGVALVLTKAHGATLALYPPQTLDVLDQHGGFTALIQGTKRNGDYTLWRPGRVLKHDTTGTLLNYGKGFYQNNNDVTWACYKLKGYRYPVVVYFGTYTGKRIA